MPNINQQHLFKKQTFLLKRDWCVALISLAQVELIIKGVNTTEWYLREQWHSNIVTTVLFQHDRKWFSNLGVKDLNLHRGPDLDPSQHLRDELVADSDARSHHPTSPSHFSDAFTEVVIWWLLWSAENSDSRSPPPNSHWVSPHWVSPQFVRIRWSKDTISTISIHV